MQERITDIELLIEDFGWNHNKSIAEIVDLLKEMNLNDHRKEARRINEALWKETFTDEMAATARWIAMSELQNQVEAIDEWAKRRIEQ